ncbi:hypothetical protein CI102_13515 [Trichoderma harzianum]|nr:hypothetical protein CI102_13515 [Trichoderma harzianum]
MAPSTKDMRRADLIVPYQEPVVKGEVTDFSSTMSSTLPMAAMFMRNKFVGWIAVVFSIQTWLGESEDSQKSSGTPGYFSVGMSGTSPSLSQAITPALSLRVESLEMNEVG